MIITIAREYGSNGREIAENLSRKLDIPLYDKAALIAEAKRQNCFDAMRRFFEEQPVNSLLYAIAMNSGIDRIEETAFAFIRSLAQKQSMVLIGRCGNYILRDFDDVTSVFVHEQMADRIARVMKKMEFSSEHKAEEYITLMDEKRKNFHKTCTGEQWGEASDYDICLNGSRMESAQAADWILDFIHRKKQ